MKKITPYIFLFIIFVNLFAPFTSDFRNKKMISFTKAEAGEDLKMSVDVSHTNDNIQLIIKLENVATLLEKIIGRSDVKLVVTAEVKKEKTGEVVYNKEVNLDCDEWALMNATCNANLKIVGLEAETKYIVKISTTIVITDIPTIGPPKISYGKVTPNMITTGSATLNSNGEIVITTNKEEDTKKKVDTEPVVEKYRYPLNTGGFSADFKNKSECDIALSADKVNSTIRGLYGSSTTNSCILVPTDYANKLNEDTKKIADAKNLKDGMPDCNMNPLDFVSEGTFTGCVAQAIYYVLFVPVSWVFALSGQFFDKVFEYSLDNASYDIEFVTNGWGVVRDFCNMFFIFVLLYIAIATILDLNHFKTKEMIINVIIIGVLINFSMLATHVMIDASNILARVFYNSDTIKITSKTSNLMFDDSKDGTIPLSMAVVNKFDPQAIVLSGYKHMDIDSYKTKGGTATEVQTTNKNDDVGVGTFIIITLMSIVMSIFGIIMFMSVGLIFVARVIGLWFAIIFSPLAFFSYMVPQLSGMKMFGWKNWWPETLKLCFLAPIFMFFLYLIIAFLDQGISLGDLEKAKGMRWWILITVPFIFIIMLMSKAKEIAKEYSGSLGQSITNGLAAVGGLALGGGAAGLAMAGRNTIGAIGKYAQNDEKRNKDASLSTKSFGQLLNPKTYANWAAANATNLGKSIKISGRTNDSLLTAATPAVPARAARPILGANGQQLLDANGNPMFTPAVAAQPATYTQRDKHGLDWLKDREKERGIGSHAEKILNDKVKELHLGDSYKDLTSPGTATVSEAIDKDLLAKEYFNSKDYSSLRDVKQRQDIDALYSGLGTIQSDKIGGGFSVGDTINRQYVAQKDGHDHGAEFMFDNVKNANGAMGEFVTALRKGSYDVRELGNTKSKSKGFSSGLALVSAVALGIRSGMKQSGIDYGKGQKDFMKDMGDLITSSLKNVKIEVPKASGGGGHDDHGDGDHGGHH